MSARHRLDKLIASSGTLSRSEVKALIRAGRVAVNGERAVSGDRKASYDDVITIDGVAIRNQEHIYLMLNKPQGVLCATRDRDCKTVLDLVPEELRRDGLFPAGRLDKDSEGFVLLTDDGDFAHRILSPRSHVPKTYHARLDSPIDMQSVSEGFAKGVVLDGGDVCSPASITLLEDGNTPLVEVVIFEGMYHQIKRMFVQYSQNVTALRRVKIGGLFLDDSLPSGGVREILHKELKQLV